MSKNQFKQLISKSVPLVQGEYCPKKLPEMFDLPCKCGHIHKHGDNTYEFFMLKMVKDDFNECKTNAKAEDRQNI